MKPIKPQFGQSASADFEEYTWTFKMPKTFSMRAGEFAILDKQDYDDLLELFNTLQINLNRLIDKEPKGEFRNELCEENIMALALIEKLK